MEVQTLDARYIDGATLLALLISLFGEGNFVINVSWPATRIARILMSS